MKKRLLPLLLAVAVILCACGFTSVDALTKKQDALHEAANILRHAGYKEDNGIIKMLQRHWWAAEETKQDIIGRRSYTENDVVLLAKTVWAEARGLNQTEQSAVIWCVLNRCDAWEQTIAETVTAPNQFAYYQWAPVEEDIVTLTRDVLDRWEAEKAGETDVGRTLPKEYLWFWGDGEHNWFRTEFVGGEIWKWEMMSPYGDSTLPG